MENSYKFKMKKQKYRTFFIFPLLYLTFIVSGINNLKTAYKQNNLSNIRFFYIFIAVFLIAIIIHIHTDLKEKHKVRYLEIALGMDFINIGKKHIKLNDIQEIKIPKYDPFIELMFLNKKSHKIYLDLYEQPDEIKALFNAFQMNLPKPADL